ncbi:hypothetical protein IMZ48_26660 [Candidatus Bathyarchaeota archaeon]|nr:hypothetical protein [Candidatus Bathyarchaeota archaeon]
MVEVGVRSAGENEEQLASSGAVRIPSQREAENRRFGGERWSGACRSESGDMWLLGGSVNIGRPADDGRKMGGRNTPSETISS